MTWRRREDGLPLPFQDVLVWVVEEDNASEYTGYALVAFVDNAGNWWAVDLHEDMPMVMVKGVRQWAHISIPGGERQRSGDDLAAV